LIFQVNASTSSVEEILGCILVMVQDLSSSRGRATNGVSAASASKVQGKLYHNRQHQAQHQHQARKLQGSSYRKSELTSASPILATDN
jgi:hypothetical protein